MEPIASFGAWLRRRRKALDLTQAELARLVGCSDGLIRMVEADARRPSRQIAERLAEALALPPEARAAFIQAARAERAIDRLDLPPDVELHNLGSHRLRDLGRPQQVFQFTAPDLPSGFLPLRTLAARPNNLPLQLTPLLGREREVAAVQDLLRREDVRLVTLTGPGGTGKTRLALQVAAELFDDFRDGVWFVNLAPIQDADLVLATIARALEVKEWSDQPLATMVNSYLRAKQLLLLLDNFEQVLDAAPVVAAILAAVPGVKALITSRAVLHLRGEHAFTVPPLALPPRQGSGARGQGSGVRGQGPGARGQGPGASDPRSLIPDPRSPIPDPRSLTQYAAVQLFVARARAARADFVVTNANAPTVAELCYRLDGLPLAIELAAARIRLFAPEALLARLERRLPLLTGGPRDLPARQQTLRNTIDWSYQLLGPAEQTLFQRLGVFVGGCTIEAAETICGDQGSGIRDQGWDAMILIPDPRPLTPIVEGLAMLVDQSLLQQAEGPDGEPRFTMLETIREYALEQLEATGEAVPMRERHAAYFVALAERAEPELYRSGQRAWQARLEAELPNLRAALSHGAPELSARLVTALYRFWFAHNHGAEGSRWVEAALAHSATFPLALRAKVLLVAGRLRGMVASRNWGVGADLIAQSLPLAREAGDEGAVALTLALLAETAVLEGDYARAQTLTGESMDLARRQGDMRTLAWGYYVLGKSAQWQGHYAEARPAFEACLALRRALGDTLGIADVLSSLGAIAWETEAYAAARLYEEERLAIERALDNRHGVAMALRALGFISLCGQGEPEKARARFEESLALLEELESEPFATMTIVALGLVELAQGNAERATARFEQSLARFQRSGDTISSTWPRHFLARVALGQGDLARARDWLRESVAALWSVGQRTIEYRLMINTIVELAGLAVAEGRLEKAAQLCALVPVVRQRFGTATWPLYRPTYERALATARARLNEATFAAAWAAGQTLSLEQAVADVLSD